MKPVMIATPATITGAVAGNQNMSPRMNLKGEQFVKDVDLTTAITALAGTGIKDDAAFTPGTDYVQVLAGEFDDAAPDSVDEGDAGAVRMSGNRNLYVQIRDASGAERGANVDASNQLAVRDADANTGLGTINATLNSPAQAGEVAAAIPDPATATAQASILAAVEDISGKSPTVVPATGSGALSLTTAVATKAFRFIEATIHLDAVPTTSENATLTLDAADGAAYDTIQGKVDPTNGSDNDEKKNITFRPDGDVIYEAGDELVLAYPNTDVGTYGARIVIQEIG